MTSLLFRRRAPTEITLQATEPHQEPTVLPAGRSAPPPVGWPLLAAAAGLAAAGVGWIIVVGLTTLGWLGAAPGTAAGELSGTLATGTRLWLLAAGWGVPLGSLQVSLVPWGATALFGYLLARFLTVAGHLAGPAADRRLRRCAAVAAVALAAYLGVVLLVAGGLGELAVRPRAVSVLAVLALSAGWGSVRGAELRVWSRGPQWARPLPAAVLASQLVLFAGGAGVLATGAILHWDRLSALTGALDAGVAGNVALLGAQLAYLPNAIVWAGSYALGAGFALGPGSVVSPAATELGLLPGLPLFGALPAEGPGSPYELLWLGIGVVAGLVAAWSVVRLRPGARFDETCLNGGLAGVLGGVVFVGVAWATGGDLGAGRLVDLGPRLPELAVMAVSTLGLSGMIGGLALGLARRGERGGDRESSLRDDPAEPGDPGDPGEAVEETVALARAVEKAPSGSR